MAKKKAPKKGKKKAEKKGLRAYDIKYATLNGTATKHLIVTGYGKKDALKKADQYMVPTPDRGAAINMERISLRQSPILLSEIIKSDHTIVPAADQATQHENQQQRQDENSPNRNGY